MFLNLRRSDNNNISLYNYKYNNWVTYITSIYKKEFVTYCLNQIYKMIKFKKNKNKIIIITTIILLCLNFF